MVRMIKAIVAGAALVVGSAAAAAQADAQTWRFNLTEATNTPSPVETTGSGMAMLTFNGSAFRVQANWQNLVSPTTVAHIHCCTMLPREGQAGVASQVPTFFGFPGRPDLPGGAPGVLAGTYDRTFTIAEFFNPGFVGTESLEMATMRLVDGLNSGRAYLNIHTVQYPAGEINGFASAVIPEPSTYALLGTGIAGLGLVARRRRSRA